MPDEQTFRVSWSRKVIEALKELGRRPSCFASVGTGICQGWGSHVLGAGQVAVVVGSGPVAARAGAGDAWRCAFLLSRASPNRRSRSAQTAFSRPSSLSFGAI